MITYHDFYEVWWISTTSLTGPERKSGPLHRDPVATVKFCNMARGAAEAHALSVLKLPAIERFERFDGGRDEETFNMVSTSGDGNSVLVIYKVVGRSANDL